MKRKTIFSKTMRSTTQLVVNRSYFDTERLLYNRLQSAPQFMQRLDLEYTLEGHDGCVNSLEWNSKGSMLASASDDNHVMIWNPFRRRRIVDLPTAHQGNIFSVKFMPNSGDTIIATGAADCRVLVYDLISPEVPIFSCRCHSTRVKRLAIAPENPNLLWSSAEDGIVLQFDIRQPHTCRGDDDVLLINLCNYIGIGAEVKCIAINQRRPEQLAVGANDPYARLYDRRMLSLSKIKYKVDDETNRIYNIFVDPRTQGSVMATEESNIKPTAAKYYSPGHYSKHREMTTLFHKTITHLTFSPDGTELLVNMGGEQIYLYDINGARPAVYLQLPPFDSQNPYVPAEPQTRTAVIDSLKKAGNRLLENEKYFTAINEYTAAIALDPNYPALYLNRANALMRRNWYGDMYEALRDCRRALNLDPLYVKAQFRMARALNEMGFVKEAEDCLNEMKLRFPEQYNLPNKGIMLLSKDIALKAEKTADGDSTSARIEVSDSEYSWRIASGDYKERFVGHCNTTTDIKEANFFGNDANYIIAGSDDGNFFIWERPSNMIHSIIKGDSAIVNCIQPHPSYCLLATSGIDHDIRLWTPQPEEDDNGERHSNNRIRLFDGTVSKNQKRMQSDPFDGDVATSCRTS